MASREGKHYFVDDIEFWAENGLIYVEDHRDDSFQVVTVRDMLQRAAVLSVERNRVTASGKVAAEDRKKLQDTIDNMVEACRTAKKQGRPDDPRVIEDLRKQRRKNILLPGANPGGPKELIVSGRDPRRDEPKEIIMP